ncbi:MAG: acyl-CoA dehydrogenase family protein [Pirellulaceae bacterium]
MDFQLSDEQRRLQVAAIDFAKKELNVDMVQRDHECVFFHEGWRKCAQFGVQGLPIPEQWGGSGADGLTTVAAMEGLGYGCRDQGLLFSINAHLWTNSIPILTYGTAAQKAKYLPGLCNGELIGANGATESEAGSDVFSMRTRAKKEGDHYVLNGSKLFVSNGPIADMIVLYATLDPEAGVLGICAFIIETSTEGLSVAREMKKMGLRTSPMAEVVLDGCRVPAENLLGREGRGAEVFNCSMAWERACILATCVGTMRRQLEQCVEYARTRRQFGQPIGKYQLVTKRIVDMKLRYETSRMLIYKVGWLLQQQKPVETDAALAKLYVSESFVQSCLDAVQIHGGSGYMTDLEIERELRDAVGSTLYSGTSEIQRNIIARGLGI